MGILRSGENVIGPAEFDQFAQIHIGGKVRHARRLLHIVGDNQDCHTLLQCGYELIDAGGGYRVERGSRLVEQQNLGFGGERARDT